MRSTLQTVPESLPTDHITNPLGTSATTTTAPTETTTTTKSSHSHTSNALKGRATSTKVCFWPFKANFIDTFSVYNLLVFWVKFWFFFEIIYFGKYIMIGPTIKKIRIHLKLWCYRLWFLLFTMWILSIDKVFIYGWEIYIFVLRVVCDMGQISWTKIL